LRRQGPQLAFRSDMPAIEATPIVLATATALRWPARYRESRFTRTVLLRCCKRDAWIQSMRRRHSRHLFNSACCRPRAPGDERSRWTSVARSNLLKPSPGHFVLSRTPRLRIRLAYATQPHRFSPLFELANSDPEAVTVGSTPANEHRSGPAVPATAALVGLAAFLLIDALSEPGPA
jgi:hypothetical protein